MTNFEKGNLLLKEAKFYKEEMENYFERGEWNIVIRKAQDMVELSLNSIFKIINVEYPKVHDVSKDFIQLCEVKGIEFLQKEKEKIINVSKWLAERRASAFYYEKIYKKEEAKFAKENANLILSIVEKIFEKLKK